MFKEGLTPSAAHAERRRLIKYPDTWPEVCADRSRLSGVLWAYDWHRQWLDKVVGIRDGNIEYNRAKEMIKEFDNVQQSVLPDRAFYGRGRNLGSQVFMTDAERNALSAALPNSVLLLCIFHVLQAQWTCLWYAKHCIAHTDKPTLISLFRRVLYAESEEELSDRLEEMYADATMNMYPQYQKHLVKDTFPKLKSWSIALKVHDQAS